MLKLLVAALQALAWPTVALAAGVVFYGPIYQSLSSLAGKLGDASKVSIGSLSVELQARVEASANPELARQIGELSPEAIEALMRIPRDDPSALLARWDFNAPLVGLPRPTTIAALEELEGKGLIVFDSPLRPFVARVRLLTGDPERTLGSKFLWYRVPQGVDSAQYREMVGYNYRVTDKGGVATEAILKAVASLLSKKAA